MPSIEWETPQDFFDTLNSEFYFTLDVCANKQNAKCGQYYSIRNNGLFHHWNGICWMNPPYDRNIGQWIAKAYKSAQEGATIVCLIQGRSTDTKWFHAYVMRASEIRFIKDRLHFGLNGKFSRANISSMVVVFKPYCDGPPKVSAIDTSGNYIKEDKRSL